MKRKKVFGIMISVLMVFAMIPFQSFGASLPFKDVPSDAWYYNDVKVAYETGLINGMDTTTFAPESNMTYAQAVKLAACMNQKYTIGSVTLTNGSPNWWDSYVDYAKNNNIIYKDYDWNSPATRAGYVEIFAYALPDEALQVKNGIAKGAIPDVSSSHPQASAIYKLYRAGILNGTDDTGKFEPNNHIRRSEVSAILTRMMNENARKELSLIVDSYSTVDLSNANIGDYVTFGHYEQDNNTANGKEAIEWKVLDRENGRALLLSKYGLDCQRYNETYTNVTWETCTLRSWLNSSFLNEAFSASEKSAIPQVTLSNTDNPNYGTVGGNNTNDRVFLLSLQEMQQYFTLSKTWTDYDGVNHDVTGYNWCIGGSKDVITSPTAYAVEQGAWTEPSYHDAEGKASCWWWLRSPGYDSLSAAYVLYFGDVRASGGFVGNGNSDGNAVRPALWVNLAS